MNKPYSDIYGTHAALREEIHKKKTPVERKAMLQNSGWVRGTRCGNRRAARESRGVRVTSEPAGKKRGTDASQHSVSCTLSALRTLTQWKVHPTKPPGKEKQRRYSLLYRSIPKSATRSLRSSTAWVRRRQPSRCTVQESPRRWYFLRTAMSRWTAW